MKNDVDKNVFNEIWSRWEPVNTLSILVSYVSEPKQILEI